MTTWSIKLITRHSGVGNILTPNGKPEETHHDRSFQFAVLRARRMIVDASVCSKANLDDILAMVTSSDNFAMTTVAVEGTVQKPRFNYVAIGFEHHDNLPRPRLVCSRPFVYMSPTGGKTLELGIHTIIGAYHERFNLDKSTSRLMRNSMREMYTPNIEQCESTILFDELNTTTVFNMVHNRYTVSSGRVEYETYTNAPNLTLTGLNSDEVGDIASAFIRDKNVLQSFKGNYTHREINPTRKVMQWIGENKIPWVISGGIFALLRDEDYTLYKVSFE